MTPAPSSGSAARLPASMRCALGADRAAALEWSYELCEDPPDGFPGVWPYSFEWRSCVHQVLEDQCGAAPRSHAPLSPSELSSLCDSPEFSGVSRSGCAFMHLALVHSQYRDDLGAWVARVP